MPERHLEFWNEDEWRKITARWLDPIKRGFATRLRVVQLGGQPASRAKPLAGFAIPLWELWHRDGQRVIYTVEYADLTNCVNVLDAFEKDAGKGKKMRISDAARIKARVAALKLRMDDLKTRLRSKRGLH